LPPDIHGHNYLPRDNIIHQGTQTIWSCTCKTSTGINTDLPPSIHNESTQTEEQLSSPDQVDMVNSTCQTNPHAPPFVFEDIKNDNHKVMFYTGLESADQFNCLFDSLAEDKIKLEEEVGKRKNLRYIDELFLVLMRLRLGLLLQDLADRFCISSSTCSSLFTKWVHFLLLNLTPLIHWPSREQVDSMMPTSFRLLFPKCRIVVDCTELFTKRSSSLVTQSLTYSHYKSRMTRKGLIGITPNGILSYVSDLWLGSISDQQITNLTQFLDQLDPMDAIMADKGFEIQKYTTPMRIELIVPPKKPKNKRFTPEEILLTRRIARLRIHVERYMSRVKKFRILDQTLPDTAQPNEIWKICNALTMFYPPLNP
jgi:hypothetical protein